MNEQHTQVESQCDKLLQPLREVGCDEKTQYWDIEDIRAAIREAYRLGISPERLSECDVPHPAA